MSQGFEITLEKGMYSVDNKTFSEILEGLDPSDKYFGTEYYGLDAFSRQLKRFDIKVSGSNSDTVEKFFQTTQTSVLFPEFVRRCVESGMEQGNNVLDDMVASITITDSRDYRSIHVNDEFDNKWMIQTNSGLVQMQKRGKRLIASYESLRFQRIDLFQAILKRYGEYITKSQQLDAVRALLLNDTNNYPIKVKPIVKDKPCSLDIAHMAEKIKSYNLNMIVASPSAMNSLLESNCYSTKIEYKNGKYIFPNGIIAIVNTHLRPAWLIGYDSECTLEMIKSRLLFNYEALIDKQFEKTDIYCYTGFNKLFKDSVAILFENER